MPDSADGSGIGGHPEIILDEFTDVPGPVLSLFVDGGEKVGSSCRHTSC